MDQAKVCPYYYYLQNLFIDTRVAKATAKPSSAEPKVYMLLLSIFSLQEMTKAVSRRTPVSASLEFPSDEPWNNVCTQILTKISAALNPPALSIANYSVHVTATHIISKPGLPLISADDYSLVLKYISKAKGDILATICEKTQPSSESEAGKENKKAKKSKSKSKKVHLQLISVRL